MAVMRLNLPFDFVPTEELPGGFCSKVYATGDRVLKVPFQGEELESGFRAALLFSGTLGPQVYENDPASGALVMDRIRPGTKLMDAGLSEEARLEIFAQHVARIQKLPTDGMLPVANYYSESHPLLDHLLNTTTHEVFLHGDLHHENILLSGEQDWIVIDPKGLRGDPAFEAATWLRNPAVTLPSELEVQKQTESRLKQMEAILGWDAWRMLAWTWADFAIDKGEEEPDPTHPWTIFERAIRPMVGNEWTI